MPLPLPARALLQSLRNGAVDEPRDGSRAGGNTAAQPRRDSDPPARDSGGGLRAAPRVPAARRGRRRFSCCSERRRADPEAYALKACRRASSRRSRRTGPHSDRQGPRASATRSRSTSPNTCRRRSKSPPPWRDGFPAVNRVRGEHALAARAIANHPQRSPEQVKKADEVVAKLLVANHRRVSNGAQTPMASGAMIVVIAAFSAAFVGVLALIGSLVARGGFTFRPFGVALVTKNGGQASRLRALPAHDRRVVAGGAPVPAGLERSRVRRRRPSARCCFRPPSSPPSSAAPSGRSCIRSRGIQDRIRGHLDRPALK